MKKKVFQKVIKPVKINFPLLKNNRVKQCEAYYYKGYEPHHQLYETKAKILLKHNAKIYCFDKIAVATALQMSYRQRKTLTILSDTRYETISIEPAQNCHNQTQKEITKNIFDEHFRTPKQKLAKNQHISPQTSQIALFLLENYKFVIKKAFLDVHPSQSYKKLCGYLMIKRNADIQNRFSQTSFANTMMKENILTVPLLTEMRQKFLHTEYLKLQTLARREDVVMTDELRELYFSRWKNIVDFDLISTATSYFDDETKLNWAILNNIGHITLLSEVLKNKYRYHYYATWL